MEHKKYTAEEYRGIFTDQFRADWNKVADLNGLHTQEDAMFLHEASLSLPENSAIFEIGTWDGRSAAIMGLALGDKGKVFTLDHYDHNLSYSPDNRYHSLERVKNNLKAKGIENVFPLQGISHIFAKTWETPIDLLFIDGDHKYESVKLDIENWLPKVKKGGFVLFHDYESHEGVLPVVNEYVEKKKIIPIKQMESCLLTQKL